MTESKRNMIDLMATAALRMIELITMMTMTVTAIAMMITTTRRRILDLSGRVMMHSGPSSSL